MSLNIIDIAKMANVSKSTVSRYLNDGYVSEEAREKIKAVIEKTGFQPQRHAKTMRTKKTNLIGVIVPKISTETAPRIVEGMTNILSPNGYDVLIANTNLSIEKEIEYLKLFKNNQVDGIVFMATKVTSEHIKAMDELEIPIVVVAQDIKDYPSVFFDNHNAAKDITKLFIDNGHKDIGFIGVYEDDISVGLHRKEGYIESLRENNIEIDENKIKIGDFRVESGYQLAKELMEGENKITAIFAVTDNIALGAIEYLTEQGYRIPKDVAVAGVGDSRISSVISPKLTTVHHHYKTSGGEAAKLILSLIEDGVKNSKNIYKKIRIPYRLIKRDSI